MVGLGMDFKSKKNPAKRKMFF